MKQENNKSQQNLKIFFILGEESGDILGEKLIKSLIDINPNIKFYGLAGSRMQQYDIRSIFSISELSLMGFLEIIPHIPKLINRINFTANKIKEINPDIVISIDSPDFSFRVVKKIAQDKNLSHIKKVHLIAPSVWAYREGRAQKIAKIYNLLLTILPFEPPFFEKYGLKTKFIGHPILQNKEHHQKGEFRKKFNIKTYEKLICLTPGSRISEVKKILPQMIKATYIIKQSQDNIKFVILATDKTKKFIQSYLAINKLNILIITQKDKYSLFTDANLAIAKSGTNNIEMSLYQLPLIITYKVNFLSYILIKLMIKIKFANLINIIANKEIIPELLQNKCKAYNLAQEAIKLLNNNDLSQKQIIESEKSLIAMGINFKETPTQLAAKYIINNAI
ncbi:lipid-A-disaccharide synthase [Rickettsiales bacterium]|nr:lipid-A-disaccharide synthase [Rickettsiales bacterium]